MRTTMVGRGTIHNVRQTFKTEDEGGRERTSSGCAVRRPKMTVYYTAVPTPEQRSGGTLFPDAPALLLEGMPYAPLECSRGEKIPAHNQQDQAKAPTFGDG